MVTRINILWGVALLCVVGAKGDDFVTKSIKGADFDSFVQSSPLSLILFYAPWCFWSRLSIPEIEAVAQILQHHTPPVQVGMIDASHMALMKEQQIKEYPTIRMYLEGSKTLFVPFQGDRSRTKILNWVDEHLNRDKSIVNADHLQKLLNPHQEHIVVVGAFRPDHPEDGETFMKVSREVGDNMMFGHSSDSRILDQLIRDFVLPELRKTVDDVAIADRVSMNLIPPYIILFTAHAKEDRVHIYTGDITDQKGLREFVKFHEFPAVSAFTMERASKMFEDRRPMSVLIIDTSSRDPNLSITEEEKIEAGDDAAEQHRIYTAKHRGMLEGENRERCKTEELFRKVAQTKKGEFLFSTSGNREAHEKRLMTLLGVEDESLPALRVITINPDGHGFFRPALKYSPEDSGDMLTEAAIVSFLENFKAGKVKHYLKSEPEESVNPGPVRVVVGKTFDKEVVKTDDDVFIEFFAPWCGHCRKLEPALKELALRLRYVKGITIAKMDATRNEVEDLSFRGYPTLMLFGKGKKSHPEVYEGDRSVRDMMHWISQRASTNFKPDELLALDTSSEVHKGGPPPVDAAGDLILEEL